MIKDIRKIKEQLSDLNNSMVIDFHGGAGPQHNAQTG
jgi:hypothetical protein